MVVAAAVAAAVAGERETAEAAETAEIEGGMLVRLLFRTHVGWTRREGRFIGSSSRSIVNIVSTPANQQHQQ
jgi:hypothetical protein